MMMRNRAILLATMVLFAPRSAEAALAGLERVASGLSVPMFITHAPGDHSRLFIAQRGGAIRILNLNTGTLEATPFLSIPGVLTTGEGGLLGMAFHPDYQSNGKFYVYITADDSDSSTVFSSYIRQYTVSSNPNIANTSFTPILSWGQPQSNHNGGWIGFSPRDHYLYIASGDGGGGNDTGTGHTANIGNAQDITDNLLGKMLRVDVNSDAFPADASRNYAIPPSNPFVGALGDDEIWAYGLRNPFRASFDRQTHDLWIGDVGQSSREEIDFQPAASTGGENYGWRLREGTIATPTSGIGGPCSGCVDPVYDYGRPLQNPSSDPTITELNKYRGTVVTGGYVYRGPDPTLQGKYFFLDSRNSSSTADDNYWFFDPASPYTTVQQLNSLLTPNTGLAQFPVSFGEDAAGNLYIAYLASGEVYRINTNQLVAGDYEINNSVDQADYNAWRTFFGTLSPSHRADGNGNYVVDAADYIIWRKHLGNSLLVSTSGTGTETAVPEPAVALLACQVLLLLAFERRTGAGERSFKTPAEIPKPQFC